MKPRDAFSDLGPLPSPSECSVAAPAALATSSCQTAACRAASSPGPGRRPCSSSGLLSPAQGPGRYPRGRKRVVRGCPSLLGPLLGGGGESAMWSALRNVLWENAEAISPSYFPWLTPRYSAGPLRSQAQPCCSTSGILRSGHSKGLNGFAAVLLIPFVSVNTCSIYKMQINIIYKLAASVLYTSRG